MHTMYNPLFFFRKFYSFYNGGDYYMNKITIVFLQCWEIKTEEYFDGLDIRYYVDYREPKIRKIFYNLEDAIKHIENTPNQKYSPDYETILKWDSEECSIENDHSGERGFYLYWKQFDIE